MAPSTAPAHVPVTRLRAALMAPATVRFVGGFRHVLERGPSCPWHAHAAIELVFHPTGRGTTRLADGTRIAFGPGAVVMYPARSHHDQTMDQAGTDVCLQVELSGRAVNQSDLQAGLLVPRLDDLRLRRECEDLAGVVSGEDPIARAALDHRATALLLGLVMSAAPLHDDHAQRAHRLIDSEYATIDGVGMVAARLGIGADHLRHVFTARYRMGPGRYLTEVRLARARDLLERSRLPLAAVAQSCGFASADYLGAAFRRATGTTPLRWRQHRAPSGRSPENYLE